MIHSANPKSLPVGIIVFVHVVRPSVRPHFSNLGKQIKAKTIFAIDETVGLAEWIIDDTCHVHPVLAIQTVFDPKLWNILSMAILLLPVLG